MKIAIAWIDVLIWTLIYGGLLTFAMGLALRGFDRALARGTGVAGIAIAAVGAFLIWVRSRLVANAPMAASSTAASSKVAASKVAASKVVASTAAAVKTASSNPNVSSDNPSESKR